MKAFDKKLTQRLKNFITKKGLYQVDLAGDLGLHKVMMCNMVNGRRKLSVYDLMVLHVEYGFPLDHTDLLDD